MASTEPPTRPSQAARSTPPATLLRFRDLGADDFVGGFVLRRFEPFTGAEVRTWWVDVDADNGVILGPD